MEYDKELIEFADKFANNFQTYDEGRYESADNNYKIEYKDMDTETPARISTISKIIDINKKKCNETTPDFMYWLILWCYTISEMPYDYLGADLEATEHYVTTERSKKQLALGFIKMVKPITPSSENKKRYEALNEFLLKTQATVTI